jgi:hypothetical protein
MGMNDAFRPLFRAGLLAAATLLPGAAAPPRLRTVFVIAMENHDWVDGTTAQLLGNPAAPFLNALVAGRLPISAETAYAAAYHNVLATPSGHNPHVHPSEPNYLWSKAGTDFGVRNDHDPYDPRGPTVQRTRDHLTGLMLRGGIAWRSYQEDTDLRGEDGAVENIPAPGPLWTVPLRSVSGRFARGVNEYNHAPFYAYAPKHNPPVFFEDSNGGNDPSPANPLARHYAPLQQLAPDLAAGAVARYNWITPDLYNDMHSPLPGGYRLGDGTVLHGDAAEIRQGDDFLARIVPLIMASRAYRDGGAIILWWDETEGGDDPSRTIPEIVISPDAKGNAYTNDIRYTHSSDLLSWQELFNVGPCLRDACNATDLSDLFRPGAIPSGISNTIPEPAAAPLLAGGLLGLGLIRRRRG